MAITDRKFDPYIEGYEAFLKGRLICPFKVGRMYFREWNRGFNTAYFDNLERIKHVGQSTKRNR